MLLAAALALAMTRSEAAIIRSSSDVSDHIMAMSITVGAYVSDLVPPKRICTFGNFEQTHTLEGHQIPRCLAHCHHSERNVKPLVG